MAFPPTAAAAPAAAPAAKGGGKAATQAIGGLAGGIGSLLGGTTDQERQRMGLGALGSGFGALGDYLEMQQKSDNDRAYKQTPYNSPTSVQAAARGRLTYGGQINSPQAGLQSQNPMETGVPIIPSTSQPGGNQDLLARLNSIGARVGSPQLQASIALKNSRFGSGGLGSV